MPRGPKGEKRSTDAIGNAVHVMRIATGEIEKETSDKPTKNAIAAELGRIGGKARTKSLSTKKRAQIAEQAAKKRWDAKDR